MAELNQPPFARRVSFALAMVRELQRRRRQAAAAARGRFKLPPVHHNIPARDPSIDLIPPVIDGLRIPARFVASVTLERDQENCLRVAGFTPWAGRLPAPQRFTAFIRDGGVWHYFHFMEAVIWLLALRRRYLPGAVLERVVFAYPWNNHTQNNVQKHLLWTLVPGLPIVDSGCVIPMEFTRVLVIDREWQQTNINKYLESSLGFAAPAVRDMSARVRRVVRAQMDVNSGGAARILYVRRPPPRCLVAEAEAELLRVLARFGEVMICDFAAVPWAQQVRLAAAHDVMVGVHGNGLTNALWMRPGSLLLELFPDGVRHYDYQLFAELAGLAYAGFSGDRVFAAFSRDGDAHGHAETKTNPVCAVPPMLAEVLGQHLAR